MHDEPRLSPAPLTWLAAACVVAVAAAASHIGADSRWLAAVGAQIVRLHALPHAIGYAAVSSSGWHDAPALGQVLFHSLDAAFGDRGLVAAQTVALVVAFCAVAADLRRSGAYDWAGAGALLLVVVGAPAAFLIVRAELYSLALFPLLVLLLRQEARFASRRLWLAVPLLALWANLHGGVLVGYAIFAAYLVLDRSRRRPLESGLALAAGAVALLATPALLGSVAYYRDVLGGEAATQHYGLWAPLSLSAPFDIVFVAVALPLLAATLVRRPAFWELAVVLALAGLSIDARRNGVWFLLFVAAPAARAFGRRRPGRPLPAARLVTACFCLPVLVFVGGLVHPAPADGAGTPLLARASAVAHGSPILADPLDAEQLALRGARVWIANPLDAFPRSDQRVYLDWLRGTPGGDAALVPQVVAVLVARDSAPQRRLSRNPSFRELARDRSSVLYGRI